VRHPEFSEFSFGFALTANLMNGGYLSGVRGAPTFPNLYSEGKTGGGYDVKIPAKGAPLFLQFKIPQVVTKSTKKRPAGFALPYYRMHLLRKNHSLQHQSLLTHARRGRLVYYVTPTFHTTTDLNYHYDRKGVPKNSIFIRPRQIGSLDDRSHHVAYTKNSNVGWLFSEPVQLAGGVDFEHFLIELKRSIQADSAKATTSVFFEALAEEIIVTRRNLTLETEFHEQQQPLYSRDRFSPSWEEGYAESAEIRAERIEGQTREQFHSLLNRYPLPAAVGYMARFYLDCELIIVGRD
jgi:hypothetical protein